MTFGPLDAVTNQPQETMPACVPCSGACQHLASEIKAVLDGFPTTVQQDEALLQELLSQTTACNFTDLQSPATNEWLQRQHRLVAVQYRLARKHLLARVAEDLVVQACITVCDT